MKAGSYPPLGGKCKMVEVDKTYFSEPPTQEQPVRGNRKATPAKHGPTFKRAIVSFVACGGQACSCMPRRQRLSEVQADAGSSLTKHKGLAKGVAFTHPPALSKDFSL